MEIFRSAIITDHIQWPNGLAIDANDLRIYWSDGKLAHIESSDLNGGNRRKVILITLNFFIFFLFVGILLLFGMLVRQRKFIMNLLDFFCNYVIIY